MKPFPPVRVWNKIFIYLFDHQMIKNAVLMMMWIKAPCQMSQVKIIFIENNFYLVVLLYNLKVDVLAIFLKAYWFQPVREWRPIAKDWRPTKTSLLALLNLRTLCCSRRHLDWRNWGWSYAKRTQRRRTCLTGANKKLESASLSSNWLATKNLDTLNDVGRDHRRSDLLWSLP